jgi:hypothetical protein
MNNAVARRSAAAAAALLIGLTLGGCSILSRVEPPQHSPSQSPTSHSESDALDRLVQEAQGQIASVKAESAGTYSDITIEAVHPNTISYTYVYAKQLDAGSAAAYFDTQAATIQQSCDTQVFPAMTAVGITSGQHAKYTYLNADGSVIWSRTFSPSD